MKTIEFANGEYYHVFNRGVDKRQTFFDAGDFRRFIKSLNDFNSTRPAWEVEYFNRGETSNEDKLVDIVAYCVNGNHFHIILKQRIEKGVSEFMRKIGTGYTMYFNKRYKRSGILFQGRFKAVHIENNNQLLYVSAYVNCNNKIHNIKSAESYPWSSFLQYLGLDNGIAVEKDVVLGQFRNKKDYRQYMDNQSKGMRAKKETNKLLEE